MTGVALNAGEGLFKRRRFSFERLNEIAVVMRPWPAPMEWAPS